MQGSALACRGVCSKSRHAFTHETLAAMRNNRERCACCLVPRAAVLDAIMIFMLSLRLSLFLSLCGCVCVCVCVCVSPHRLSLLVSEYRSCRGWRLGQPREEEEGTAPHRTAPHHIAPSFSALSIIVSSPCSTTHPHCSTWPALRTPQDALHQMDSVYTRILVQSLDV
jgi:hypothetical protein